MAVKIQHLRSAAASKRPTTTALLDGELSLNTNVGTPGIYFKDSAGTAIIKVGPAEVGSSAPNSTPASGGSAGNSVGEFWLDTANTAGNGQPALKIFNGTSFGYVGKITLGGTNIELGAAATTTLSGLTSLSTTTLDATSSVDLENQADLRFYEATANGTNYVGFQAPASITSDVLWTLPTADGAAGQFLSTNGSGVLSWGSVATNSISQGNSSVTVTDTGSNGTITFATEGVNCWSVNSSGHFVPGSDSTFNIGASGTEVLNVYADNLYGTLQSSSQTNITGVGTLTAGTWTAGTIGTSYGGTGQTTYTDGQLLIGNSTGNTLTKATLTQGTGLSITNGAGSITLAVAASVPTSIATDSGTATPATNTFTISGGTGLSSSGAGTAVTLNLDNTSVVASPYGSSSQVATFTVDAQGRLTAAANVSIGITASQVSDFDTQVRTSRLDQMAAPTAPVSFNNQRVTDVATPLLPTDAANKAYADSIAQSLNVHGAADYATTAAVSYAYVSGGTLLTITTITGTDTITFSSNHGLSTNSQLRTGTTTTGTGLIADTTYYVTSIPALNQVKVSATYGGANATLTNGTGLSIGVTGDPGIGATLTGCPNSVDSGSTLTAGQRILVKDHTTAAYNGVYSVTTVGTGANGVWTRAADFDNGPTGEITSGDYVFVANGTVNGSNGFIQTSPPPIRMGKAGAGYGSFAGDSISFTQFSGAGQITAGLGLSKSGNTLDVNADSRASGTKTIDIVSDEVRIDSAWTGQTSLTTLGTITAGTWNATAIGLTYGGTGQSNANITSRYVFMGPAGSNGNAAFREFTTADVNPTTNGSFDAGSY